MSAESDPISLCAAGVISPEVAVARLLLLGWTAEQGLTALEGVADSIPVRAMRMALGRADIAILESLLDAAGIRHAQDCEDQDRAVASIAAMFDRAVMIAPEASVALYSLGDRGTLARATAELASWLESRGLLGPDCDVLDLGCGIGRIAAGIAGKVRSVLGLDSSPAMIAEARRRTVDHPNLEFRQTSGTDLDAIADRKFDLAIAVDSFPYLLQAGYDVAERHIAGTARLLREPGCLVICNLSYGRTLAQDERDLTAWCDRYGFTLDAAATRPFTLWDGTAFVLRRVNNSGHAGSAAQPQQGPRQSQKGSTGEGVSREYSMAQYAPP